MPEPKSIVLVTVDCLRADHTGFMGYGLPTTPFLNTLAEESLIFPAAIVAGAPTYYSFPGILGGRSPLALGRDVLGLVPTESTLASTLKQAGYATAAFSAANPYISARFGYDQGFDTFHDFLEASPLPADGSGAEIRSEGWASRLNKILQATSGRLGPVRALYNELYFQYCLRWAVPPAKSLDSLRCFPAADVVVDQAGSWLASIGQSRFFLWLHLMDPHAPYYPTEKALQSMGQDHFSATRARYVNAAWHRNDVGADRWTRHLEDVIALYDAGIRWVDDQMARLMDALQRLCLWENCIFVLTADHGEEFLDHGGRYHPPSRPTEELIRVPLLLRVPAAAKRNLSPSPFSLVDLPSTLIEAAGVGARSLPGRSRWPQILDGAGWDDPVVVESIAGCTNPFHRKDRYGPRVLAVRDRRYKLVLDFEPAGERLYDLEADPKEGGALPPGAEKAIRRRLLEHAREHVENSRRNRDLRLLLQARLRELRLEWANPMTPAETAGF